MSKRTLDPITQFLSSPCETGVEWFDTLVNIIATTATLALFIWLCFFL